MRQKSEKRAEKCNFPIRFIVFAIHNKQTTAITSLFVAQTKKENCLLLPTNCIIVFSGEIRMEHSPLKKYTFLLASNIRTSHAYAHASHAHILQGFCFFAVTSVTVARKTCCKFQQNDPSLKKNDPSVSAKRPVTFLKRPVGFNKTSRQFI